MITKKIVQAGSGFRRQVELHLVWGHLNGMQVKEANFGGKILDGEFRFLWC